MHWKGIKFDEIEQIKYEPDLNIEQKYSDHSEFDSWLFYI